MSYEGRVECLCKNGHRFTIDCNESNFKCDTCQADVAWSHGIDDTNFDSVGDISEEDWQKFLIAPPKTETCNLNHVHIIEEARFRAPTVDECADVVRCIVGGEWWMYCKDIPRGCSYEEMVGIAKKKGVHV